MVGPSSLPLAHHPLAGALEGACVPMLHAWGSTGHALLVQWGLPLAEQSCCEAHVSVPFPVFVPALYSLERRVGRLE